MFSLLTIGENHPHLDAVRALFREYNDFLGFDLCFQGFKEELALLPGKYGAPDGRLYLAMKGEDIAGCVAFYRLSSDTCELKRLYVRPTNHGCGLGKQLMLHAMEQAKAMGYRTMRLDSLRRLASAQALYHQLGFTEISPFNGSPLEDVYYMERRL